MTTRTLYRAASDDDVRPGYSFAARRADAEAYLDNPGFGGPTLYRTSVATEYVIDLTDGSWESLSEACGEEIDPSRHQYHFAGAITASDKVVELLAAAGYQWAMIIDDYPADCVTYVPLTADAADAAEAAMTVIE